MNGDPHRQRSGVKFRRGQPLGRARSSGGFARRANFNDHETARSCCEPSRGLDAVERRWSWPGTPRVRRITTATTYSWGRAIRTARETSETLSERGALWPGVWRIRWGGRWRAVSPVPADGGATSGHDHGGQLLGHGLGVVVTGPCGELFGRGHVPQDRGAQLIEVNPSGHTISPVKRHNRTSISLGDAGQRCAYARADSGRLLTPA